MERYWGEALVKGTDQADAIEKGVADVAFAITLNYTPERFPYGEWLCGLPFLAMPTSAEEIQVIDAVWDKWLSKDVANSNIMPVAVYDVVSNQLQFKAKKVTKVEDMKGLKVRVSGGGMVSIMQKLGAIPVTGTSADAYMMLDKGIVDANCQVPSSVASNKIYELVKYYLEINVAGVTNYHAFNKQSWLRLPEDIRAIITQINKGLAASTATTCDASDAASKKEIVSHGVEWYNLPPAEAARWRQVTQPIYKDIADRLDKKCLAGYDFINALLKEYEKRNIDVTGLYVSK